MSCLRNHLLLHLVSTVFDSLKILLVGLRQLISSFRSSFRKQHSPALVWAHLQQPKLQVGKPQRPKQARTRPHLEEQHHLNVLRAGIHGQVRGCSHCSRWCGCRATWPGQDKRRQPSGQVRPDALCPGWRNGRPADWTPAAWVLAAAHIRLRQSAWNGPCPRSRRLPPVLQHDQPCIELHGPYTAQANQAARQWRDRCLGCVAQPNYWKMPPFLVKLLYCLAHG